MIDIEEQLTRLDNIQELKLLRKLKILKIQLDDNDNEDPFTSTPMWNVVRRMALIKLINKTENQLKNLK